MWRRLTVAVLAFSLFPANLCATVPASTVEPPIGILPPPSPSTSSSSTSANQKRISEAYGKLPLVFEKNAGQIDPQVKFFSRASGHGFYLTSDEALVVGGKRSESPRDIVKMRLHGANPQPAITGIGELVGKTNYFIGDDPAKWKTDIPSFEKVKYEGVYSGIDVVYYGTGQQIEYDFIVAPGSNHQQIRLNFSGTRSLRLEDNGDLVVGMNDSEFRHLKPFIYQEIDGHRIEVAGKYLRLGKSQIGFEIGSYDRSRTLVIDPVISFSTYLGGEDEDWGEGIAVDANGNSYIAGYTFSGNFPVTRNKANLYDAFVVKLNPSGSAYVYKTFFGGSDHDRCYSIAVDSAGSAYLSGQTASTNFPRVNALQNSRQGFEDGWITKMNAAGNGMVYSTYFGGSSVETIRSIAVDSTGSAYFAGHGSSTNLPVVSAFQPSSGGGLDGFVGKLTVTGNALVYLSYLGGSGSDLSRDIAVDTAGNTYVASETTSTNFPIINALQVTNAGASDAAVTKVEASGAALIYSTYLGGSANDFAFGVDVDDSGNVYVVGETRSSNYPVSNAAQSTLGGIVDGFVTKLNADASAFVYSTFIGGSNTVNTTCGCQSEGVNGIAVKNGNAYVIGTTDTVDFPQINPVQPAYGGGSWDAFTAKYDAFGNVIYATYFGGGGPQNTEADGQEQGFGIAVDANGDSYLTGITGSLEYPTVSALQPTYGGGGIAKTDAFAAKILDIPGFAISGQILDAGNNPIAGVTVSLTGSRTLTAQTNASGNYSFSGLGPGYNCTVTPSKNLYTFDPPSQTFNNLSASHTANFTGTGLNTYTISGRVSKSDGSGVVGVTISLTGSQSRTQLTDSMGNYAFSLLVQGESFTVTPSLPPSYLVTNTFTPGSFTFNDISSNQTANFNLAVTTNVSMYPVADAYVEDGGNAATNFGTVTPLLLKTATQTGQRRDVYLRYDLSTVSRKITNAKLRIFAALSAAGSVSTAASSVIDTTWVETAINWNNKPNSTPISGSTVSVISTTFATYDLDITSHVLAEQSAGRDVFSVALHNPSNSTPHILLNAREAATNKPQLILTTLDTNNAAPSVALTSPTNAASYFAPATVSLSATASDSDGSISKVDYYAGTNLIGTATVSPYNAMWTNVGPGNYTITAVATDNQGQMTVSSGAQISVNNGNIPPSVSITEPMSNVNFSAGSNIAVSATASDVDGNVTQVEFFAGATSVGSDTTAPYGITWNNVAPGSHTLTARATDNAGGFTNSAPVNIQVVSQTGFVPVADAYVKDGSTAATNFGSATELQVQQGATGSNRESYLRFDLTTVTGVAQARLRVYGRLSDTTGANVGVGAYSVANTTWAESGSNSITWNTKPAAGATALTTAVVKDNIARWYEFDVSGYIQSEKNAQRHLVTLALKSHSASNPYVIFNSREATTNRPQLVIWTTQARNALFVVGSSNLNVGDADAKTRLESLGFTVTVKVGNSTLNTADANGKALVVISSTCNATNVTNKFRHVAVPVINWEFDIHDDLGMTGTTSGSDFGTSSTAHTQLSIPNAGHPLAAGLSETVTVVTSSSNFSWGAPNANAAKIATLTNDVTKSVIFGYENGATMPGLDAPARRVALFMTDLTADTWNSNGAALFDAALRWATEVITGPTINLLTPNSGPTNTVVTITGFNFGQTQGSSTVTFEGVPANPSSWSDKAIAVAVPPYAMAGVVVVTVSNVTSNGVLFTVGDIDTDADGLPDWWELQYFGNLAHTANGDSDGDGLNNLQEYLQGRNPTIGGLEDTGGAINLQIFSPLSPIIP